MLKTNLLNLNIHSLNIMTDRSNPSVNIMGLKVKKTSKKGGMCYVSNTNTVLDA